MIYFVYAEERIGTDKLAEELNTRQQNSWFPWKLTAEYIVVDNTDTVRTKSVLSYHVVWRKQIITEEEYLSEARQIVARIWTEPEHSRKTMDPPLAESMARLLLNYM